MAKASLLSLPGELRNIILRDIVTSTTTLNVEPLCENWTEIKLHQPAIAFTCKTLRNEALSIYYAENSFFLGKIGYHDPSDIRLYDFNLRMNRWKEMLGPYAKYLSRLSMIIDGLCYAWDDGIMPGDAMYEMEAEAEGSVKFKMNGRLRCTCRLKPGVVENACQDGKVLLDVMQEYSASYCEAVREGCCTKCGLSRLEKFGRTEVTHQRNWEDIVTC